MTEIARIKVTLQGIRPPIWRRLEVSTETTMAHLSDVIQAGFGWTNSHLHEFEVGKRSEAGCRRIGMPDLGADDGLLPTTDAELAELFPWLAAAQARLLFPPPLEDEATVSLAAALEGGLRKLTYTYDFGDNWKHLLQVEKLQDADSSLLYPRCTAGRRAAPPEDCGGLWGYEHLRAVLADPSHEEYAELREQHPYFDPEEFDLAAADAAVRNPPAYWE